MIVCIGNENLFLQPMNMRSFGLDKTLGWRGAVVGAAQVALEGGGGGLESEASHRTRSFPTLGPGMLTSGDNNDSGAKFWRHPSHKKNEIIQMQNGAKERRQCIAMILAPPSAPSTPLT